MELLQFQDKRGEMVHYTIHMKRLCMESEMLHYFLGGTLLTG